MGRFSIARLMLWVGFVAANLAALRFLLSPGSQPEYPKVLLAGLIPLADGLILAVSFAATRHRIAVRRRRLARAGTFVLSFAALCGLFLVSLILLYVLIPDLFTDYFETVESPAERFLRSLGIDTVSDTLFLRYTVLPSFLGLIFSGPALAMATVMAWILSRFRVVITPRVEAPREA